MTDAIRAEAEYGHEIERQLTAEVTTATGWGPGRTEQGEAAWNALLPLEEELERRAADFAQELSPAEWLWHLRRASWLWYGLNRTATTGPHVWARRGGCFCLVVRTAAGGSRADRPAAQLPD